MKMRLSPHFTESEFECHGDACCGHASVVHPYLVLALEQLRDLVKRPVNITCGFRCRRHNLEVKGAATDSLHCRGLAADLWVQGITPAQLALLAEGVQAFRHGGIGLYTSWVHVDIGEVRRWKGEGV
jgi:uncharacterized protein YcbK (DUF882 family)